MPGGVIPAACRSARWAHPRGHYIHHGITTPLPWLSPVRRHRVRLHQSDYVDADASGTTHFDERWSELDSARLSAVTLVLAASHAGRPLWGPGSAFR